MCLHHRKTQSVPRVQRKRTASQLRETKNEVKFLEERGRGNVGFSKKNFLATDFWGRSHHNSSSFCAPLFFREANLSLRNQNPQSTHYVLLLSFSCCLFLSQSFSSRFPFLAFYTYSSFNWFLCVLFLEKRFLFAGPLVQYRLSSNLKARKFLVQIRSGGTKEWTSREPMRPASTPSLHSYMRLYIVHE